jgi:hypothetical protein
MEHDALSEWEKRSINRSIIMERWNTGEAIQTAGLVHHHIRTLLGVPRVRARLFIVSDYRRTRLDKCELSIAPDYRTPRGGSDLL